jgi:GNAT superfamily N-acetyltransferase
MYTSLKSLTLKSGETVELGLVAGPDADWVNRIDGDLLAHKGPVWRWGNRAMLTQDLGIDALFYVLHRRGVPFANVMTIEYGGIGILGHVYTRPEDRRQGAASLIFESLMPHFRNRGGRFLSLGTGYDSAAYHIYKSFGFAGIAPQSGTMTYHAQDPSVFEDGFLAPGPTRVETFGPKHYPVTPVLFLRACPGIVRACGTRLFGRTSTDGPFIPLLRDELERQADGKPPRTGVLVQTQTGAVVGFASTDRDPTWPNTCVVDVFCLPEFWTAAGELLGHIQWPAADQYVAYCDAGWTEKEAALRRAGFTMGAALPGWVAKSRLSAERMDVNIWIKKQAR